jgi:hypothetical protein
LYCRDHKLNKDMINLKGYICAFGACHNRAAFGYTKKDGKFYCKEDAEDDMINVLNKMCIECNKKQQTFNVPENKKPEYCKNYVPFIYLFNLLYIWIANQKSIFN